MERTAPSFERKRFFTTFLSALLFGLFAHLFGMIQSVASLDSLVWTHDYGGGVSSGRWMLALLGELYTKWWGGWNLTFHNNLMALLLLGLSAYMILRIFDVRDLWLCGLWGGLFVSFPTVTVMFFYAFTAPYYALAILATVTAVYLTDRWRYGFLAAIPLLACSLGVYQGFFPIAAGLYILLLIGKAFTGSSFGALLLRGLYYGGNLLGGLLIYFSLMKVSISRAGIGLTGYQGINQMGAIHFSAFPQMGLRIFDELHQILTQRLYHVVNTPVIRTALVVLLAFSLAAAAYLAGKRAALVLRKGFGAGFVLLLVLLPLALHSIVFMCPNSYIYTLMVYALVLFFFLPILMLHLVQPLLQSDRAQKVFSALRGGVLALLLVVILNYGMQSNLNYTSLTFHYKQASAYWTGLVTQVQSQPDFSPDLPWAFVGYLEDDRIANPFYDEALSYDQNPAYLGTRENVFNGHARFAFINQYLGLQLPLVSDETLLQIQQDPAVQAMPAYPADGSISVQEDVILIRLTLPED